MTLNFDEPSVSELVAASYSTMGLHLTVARGNPPFHIQRQSAVNAIMQANTANETTNPNRAENNVPLASKRGRWAANVS